MTDENTHAIDQYLDEREYWDALQEIIVERDQAESDNLLLIARIEELETKLAKAEWLLCDASVQLREGRVKTRRNRADLIDSLLAELKGETE